MTLEYTEILLLIESLGDTHTASCSDDSCNEFASVIASALKICGAEIAAAAPNGVNLNCMANALSLLHEAKVEFYNGVRVNKNEMLTASAKKNKSSRKLKKSRKRKE